MRSKKLKRNQITANDTRKKLKRDNVQLDNVESTTAIQIPWDVRQGYQCDLYTNISHNVNTYWINDTSKQLNINSWDNLWVRTWQKQLSMHIGDARHSGRPANLQTEKLGVNLHHQPKIVKHCGTTRSTPIHRLSQSIVYIFLLKAININIALIKLCTVIHSICSTRARHSAKWQKMCCMWCITVDVRCCEL